MPRRPTLAIAALLAAIAVLAAACTLPARPGRGPDEPERASQVQPSSRPPRAPSRKPGPTWATAAPCG